ncbi:hypothetical protein Tco_1295111 [Tanacetum coccineum]
MMLNGPCLGETYPSQRFLPEVARSPTLKANDGIGICPLGSWVVVVTVVVVIVIAVVVVICSCRPAPTVLGQVAKLLAVSAFCLLQENSCHTAMLAPGNALVVRLTTSLPCILGSTNLCLNLLDFIPRIILIVIFFFKSDTSLQYATHYYLMRTRFHPLKPLGQQLTTPFCVACSIRVDISEVFEWVHSEQWFIPSPTCSRGSGHPRFDLGTAVGPGDP